MLRLVLGLTLLAAPAFAQSACEAKCHRDGSECMKACTGDPKDAQKPEHGKQLMQCVSSCQQQTKTCKRACPPPSAPPPAPR
jgi:hypothetical protein